MWEFSVPDTGNAVSQALAEFKFIKGKSNEN
jgi:hypothetical protein